MFKHNTKPLNLVAIIRQLKQEDDFLDSLIEYIGLEDVDDVSAKEFLKQSMDQVLKDRLALHHESRAKMLRN